MHFLALLITLLSALFTITEAKLCGYVMGKNQVSDGTIPFNDSPNCQVTETELGLNTIYGVNNNACGLCLFYRYVRK
jgi:hypothetical protein